MNHNELIELGHAFGYKGLTKMGVCFGFTMMWIQAACDGDKHLNEFNKRLQLMNKMSKNPLEYVKQLEEVREKSRNREPLSNKEWDLLEIPAFFENLELYQNAPKHKELLGKPSSQANAEDITHVSKFTTPIDVTQPLASKSSRGQFEGNEIETYLEKLTKELEDKKEVGISFTSSNHAVGARYLGNGQFEYIDVNFDTEAHNTIKPRILSTQELAAELRKSFEHNIKFGNEEGALILGTYFFSRNPEVLEELSAGLLSQEKITTLKSDAGGWTLLHEALALDDKDLYNRLEPTKEEINQVTRAGKCPLTFVSGPGKEALFDDMLKKEHIDVNPPNCTLDLPISTALIHEQWDKAQRMIDHPSFDPHKTDYQSANYLHAIVISTEPEALKIAQRLIDKGVDVNLPTNRDLKATPFHYACWNNNTEMVKLFLDNHADISKQSAEKKTPLHFACIDGKPETAALLLDRGAKVNVQDVYGKLPLHYASEHSSVDLVSSLVKKDPSTCNTRSFLSKNTPLGDAKDPAVIALLLPHTNLSMQDIQPNADIYKNLQNCPQETKKEFLVKALKTYIEDKKADTNLLHEFGSMIGIGYSTEDKLNAAGALLKHIEDPKKNPLDRKWLDPLKNGRLNDLYQFYKEAKLGTTITPHGEAFSSYKQRYHDQKTEAENKEAYSTLIEEEDTSQAMGISPGRK